MLCAEEVTMYKYELTHCRTNNNVLMILRHLANHGMQQLPTTIPLLSHTFLLHFPWVITTHIPTISTINTIHQFIMVEIINLNKWIKVELKEFLYML